MAEQRASSPLPQHSRRQDNPRTTVSCSQPFAEAIRENDLVSLTEDPLTKVKLSKYRSTDEGIPVRKRSAPRKPASSCRKVSGKNDRGYDFMKIRKLQASPTLGSPFGPLTYY